MAVLALADTPGAANHIKVDYAEFRCCLSG